MFAGVVLVSKHNGEDTFKHSLLTINNSEIKIDQTALKLTQGLTRIDNYKLKQIGTLLA